MWRIIYWVIPRTPEGGQAGKGDKLPPLHILRSRGAHTQPSLATFKGGIWRRKGEEIIKKLANLEIRKLAVKARAKSSRQRR